MAEEGAGARDRCSVVKRFCHLCLETAGGGNAGSNGEGCCLNSLAGPNLLNPPSQNPSNIKHCFSSVF